ncbi:MAG: GDP-mannose 4,6-dehydratase [Nanoarchaeota archaeon]|nr:GDP-mannose 4,6-dehydratase [Nanoarchaeota archaeon]
MAVLVTGCAGFIASHIAEQLLAEGHDVIGIDNFDPYYSEELKKQNLKELEKHKSFRFLNGSILDKELLKTVKDIEIVNHQAAIAGVRNSIENPTKYCEINVLGTVNLLEQFRDAEKFIFASSSSVYGEVNEIDLPCKESSQPKPIAPYGLSKLHAEQFCEMFTKVYGLKTATLRYFTVYGPRQRPDEAMCRFITSIFKGEPIQVYADGEQTRDFSFVKDVVQANMLAINRGQGIFNIGSGNRISVNNLVNLISSLMDKKVKIKYPGKQEGDVSHTLADITKAKKILGYEPKYSIEQGLKNHIEWIRTRV